MIEHPFTLHDALETVAAELPELTLDFPDEGEAVTAAALVERSRRAAAVLADRGVGPGSTVGLLTPNAPEFFVGFFGALRAGAAAAPLSLPLGADLADWVVRLQAVVAASGSGHIVVSGRIAERLAPVLATLEGVDVVPDVELDAVADPGPDHPVGPAGRAVGPDDPALVQFTSGSTARPKGVVLTHGQVGHCTRAIAEAIELDRDDVYGSWLPLFHDMGLVGALTGLLHGVPLHLWSPHGFVRRPARWLEQFARCGATIATSPNFGYDSLVAAVDDETAASLDLSRWRVAFNGAEAISPAATRAFLDRFAVAGFRPGAMLPAYGMAEATLAVTLAPVGRPLLVEQVDRERLTETGEAVAVDPGDPGAPPARGIVGLGRAVPGVEVRVADGERTQGDGRVGEIQLRGRSVTSGYRDVTRPGASAGLFTADGWLRSGDLGYLRDGELFFTGRTKEMVTVAGRNLYPVDVEDVARSVPGVHRGRCVAVAGAGGEGGERIDLVVETTTTGTDADAVAGAVRARVVAALGAVPLAVHPVPPRSIPRTTSGKVRRLAVRAHLTAPADAPRGDA